MAARAPRASWPGYDYLMQAEAGYLSLTGEPDQPPARFGLSIVDMMAGVYAATALLGGIVAARATGVGRDVDVSLFDTALSNLNYLAAWFLNGGHAQGREPRGAHPSLTPSQLYRTADGWIFIMCNKQKFWPVLCEKLGRPEWSDDPRFASFKARLENRAELTRLLDAALSEREPRRHWLAHFAGEVPAAPVHDIAHALGSEFVTQEDRVWSYDHPQGDSPHGGSGIPLSRRGDAATCVLRRSARIPIPCWRSLAMMRDRIADAARGRRDLMFICAASHAVPASPCRRQVRNPWSSDMA